MANRTRDSMTAKQRNQQRAIAALLSQPTLAQAAQAAGISARAMRSYMAEPCFRAALADAYNDMIEDARHAAIREFRQSFVTLAEIRDNPKASNSDRIRAASKIIDSAIRLNGNVLDDMESGDADALFWGM